jgi:predicted alpha/beta-fold hydrolase
MKKENLNPRSETPFVPHPAIKGAHAQTLMAFFIPRSTVFLSRNTEPRFFDVAPGVRVLGQCSWQTDRSARPTLLVVHGLEGSAESSYMLGTAEKALAAGFNVVRLNVRSCGGTLDLTPTLYHAGLTDDLHWIIEELSSRDGLNQLYLAGFSLGGNMALKLAGEYGAGAPKALKGVVAVSPSIHLASCADAIEMRSNLIYRMSFIMSLRRSMRQKARLYPERYDESRLRGIWSIREFDDVYTAPHSGFRDVADYYERASSLPYIKNVALPVMIIHSQDDPFIPFAPFTTEEVTSNPNVTLLAPSNGGHCGFISARPEGDDRFWAEKKIVDFVRTTSEDLGLSH